MAAYYLIATLMVLQGLLFSYSMVVGDMAESGSGDDDISSTPSQMMSTPSSSVVPRGQGPNVTLNLEVSIDCNDVNFVTIIDVLEDDIEEVYKNASFPIHSVIVMVSCDEEVLDAIIIMWFYTGIPAGKTIKGVFDDALNGNKITNLTSSNTDFNITFAGVSFTYVPKEGECQAICCDGGGGPLTVERVCTPEDKCEGIEPAEKEEDGHCPREEIGDCPDTCDDKKVEEDSGSRNNLPAFPLVILLVLTKAIFS